MTLSDERLRSAGLSRPKIRTLRALCDQVLAGAVDLEHMDGMSDEEIHEALEAVSGIGPWTADIYIMFCLGRADAFAPGDLALQIALAQAMDLPERPRPAELEEIADGWRPWRAVAARMLWSYYALTKKLKAGTPM